MKLLLRNRIKKKTRRRLPLRLRLVFWSGGLVLTLCLVLVFFINGIASGVVLPGSFSSVKTMSCGSTAFAYVQINTLETSLYHNLWQISLVGLALVALLGCLGTYWFTGASLRPLRDVSVAAEQIDKNSLHTRLDFDGPADEIKSLADSFDHMLARLERTFEAQNRFVGDVSHELRTPLALLRTNLEVAAQNQHASLSELIATQEQAVTRLESLIADLLVLATGEQPFIPQHAVCLGPLTEEVLDELYPLAQARAIVLSLRGELECVVSTGDEGKLLTRVFRNLIENAIGYNRPGGQVVVTLGTENECAVIRVADTGIGMTEEQQRHIFERFYRAENARTRTHGGVGLGLSIVSTIVKQHGGTLSVTSQLDRGSVFTVRLPLS